MEQEPDRAHPPFSMNRSAAVTFAVSSRVMSLTRTWFSKPILRVVLEPDGSHDMA
jgi:hypothetical protein